MSSAFDMFKEPVQQTKELAVQNQKDFVSESDYQFGNMWKFSKIREYTTKEEQVTADKGWFFKANDRIASACASIDLKLMYKQPDGDLEEQTSGELYDRVMELMEQPNRQITGTAMRKLWHKYMNLNGEAYIVPVDEFAGLPLFLHILPSQYVQYIMAEDGQELVLYNGQALDPEMVWREHNPDPASPIDGMSVVRAFALTIEMEEQAKQFNNQFFANSARPSILVEAPQAMKKDMFNRLKQQIQEFNVGTLNAYKPLILEGGATGKPFALSQRDMDFLDSRKYAKDELLAAMGVSPAILGMVENVNRSNMDAAKAIFAEFEIRDRIKQEAKFWTRNLLKGQKGYEFGFEDPVPADRELDLKEKEASVSKWRTINEIRAEEGLEPIEGGDVIPGLGQPQITAFTPGLAQPQPQPQLQLPAGNAPGDVIEGEIVPDVATKALETFKKELAGKLVKAGVLGELSKKKLS
jgi:HK97 family phage portal protein